MKKIAIGIIIGAFLATAIPVAADTLYEKLTATTRPDYKITLDGKDVELSSAPKIIEGSTHLPLKDVAKLIGKEATFKDGVISITTPETIETEIEIPLSYDSALMRYKNTSIAKDAHEIRIAGYERSINEIKNGAEGDASYYEKLLEYDRKQLAELQEELDYLLSKYPQLANETK